MFAISNGFVTWNSKNRNWTLEHKIGTRKIWIQGLWHAQSAIVYDDGRIAYDSPEAVPKYIKAKVEHIAKHQIMRYPNAGN